MKFKQVIASILRKMGLIDPADYLRFLALTYKNASTNKHYLKKNPKAKIPPDIMMYEIFGNVDYFNYCRSGEKAAESILLLAGKYNPKQKLNILEWGSGTARILAWLADKKSSDLKLFGTDINREMADWCSRYIPNADFSVNNIKPPLHYASNSMDIIYSTSVLTHLAFELQKPWIDEIMRVLKSDGIFIFTVHGDYYAESKLNPEEYRMYSSIGFVERKNADEGSRTLAVFHSPKFMKQELLKDYEILAHYPKHDYELAGSQDIWIIKKSENLMV